MLTAPNGRREEWLTSSKRVQTVQALSDQADCYVELRAASPCSSDVSKHRVFKTVIRCIACTNAQQEQQLCDLRDPDTCVWLDNNQPAGWDVVISLSLSQPQLASMSALHPTEPLRQCHGASCSGRGHTQEHAAFFRPSRRHSTQCRASVEQDLLDFAQRRGVNVEKLVARPAHADGGHLVLRSTRSLPRGETVVSIPKQVGCVKLVLKHARL